MFGRFTSTEGGRLDVSDVPILSVLRDTLGDQNPDNDRLRYVWILTGARLTLVQRAAAAIPFLYWRTSKLKGDRNGTPAPIIDLSAATRGLWMGIAGSLAQTLVLNSEGMWVRSPTQSYRNNLGDYRRLHLLEGLGALSELENDPEVQDILSEPEMLEMEARLTLAGQMLGGLVTSSKLPQAYMKQRTRTEEERGHNWELLRQKAEADGLYFEPLGLNSSPTHALLWIASDDLKDRPFDGQFLGISDPYKDQRLKKWTGYRETRWRSDDGRWVDPGTEGAHPVELIPLALYSLDYPKVPLLMVDFRKTHGPKEREMIRHAAKEAVSGVLGISQYTNLPMFAASWTWNFVTTRHGAAANRAARLKSYSQIREWLALDTDMAPGLRAELQKRLEVVGVNPLEDSLSGEAQVAKRQYDALLRYAEDPEGLARRLNHDREVELFNDQHGWGSRFAARTATIASFGFYRHREGDVIERLDVERRIARHTQFLETVAQSNPQTPVIWNLDDVRHALDDLASAGMPERSAKVVRRILEQTKDEETKQLCERALQGFDATATVMQ